MIENTDEEVSPVEDEFVKTCNVLDPHYTYTKTNQTDDADSLVSADDSHTSDFNDSAES